MSIVDRETRLKYNEELEKMSPENAVIKATEDLFKIVTDPKVDLHLFEEQLISFTQTIDQAQYVSYGTLISIIAKTGMKFEKGETNTI